MIRRGMNQMNEYCILLKIGIFISVIKKDCQHPSILFSITMENELVNMYFWEY